MPGLQDRFREVAVDDAELAFDERVAVFVGVDDGRLQEAWAGQDGPQIALREASSLGVAAVEHEELVAAGGNSAVDMEEVSQGRAVGVELDPGFCDAARDLWAEAGLDVVPGDFTRIVATSIRPVAPNLILANPPYIRHHHLQREDKDRLQALAYRLTGVEVNGLAGLYVYFLLLATAWLEDGGYAAWLIPSEFMDVNYGAALKRYLTDCVTLIRAHRFDPDDVQFGDALVSSVVLVFRKMAPPPAHAVEFTFGGTMRGPHASDSIPLDQLRESRKWTVYPSHARNDRRAHTVHG